MADQEKVYTPNSSFQSLTRSKFRNFFRPDLDCFSGLRVTTRASSSFDDCEGPKAYDCDLITLFSMNL